MNQINKYQHIAHLIVKERLTGLSKAETEKLNLWINEHQDHYNLYKKLRKQNPADVIQNYKNIDIERGLQTYHRRHSLKSRRLSVRWMTVAAASLILISTGILLFFKSPSTPPLTEHLQPGSSKALLILADGTVKELQQTPKTDTIHIEGVSVLNSGNEIQYTSVQYNSDTLSSNTAVYNTLKIPTGGEYMLILADGTQIWLNSQTTLRYPVKFTGNERTVYLEGEAYFKVNHDKQRPFYVHTKDQVNIQVLGTSFNVRAYGDEQETETVLEHGSVKMWRDKNHLTLVPGVKATYNKNNDKFTAQHINTELYTAWHKGQYVFEEETIENILNKLSRWYGIQVFFADPAVRNMIFSGSIRKYDTIQQLLNAIEATGGIRFRVNGSAITVSSQPKISL